MRQTPSIDDLESQLYNPDATMPVRERRGVADGAAGGQDLPRGWSATGGLARPPRRPSSQPFLVWIFLAACAFAAIAFAIMSLSLAGSGRSVSTKNIDMQIVGKSFAEGGESLNYDVVIRNSNNAALQLADLVVEYPETGDEGTRTHEERRNMGTIAARSERIETFDVRLYGATESVVTLSARLEYRVSGSRSIFVRKIDFPVTLQSAPMTLVVTGPETVSANQDATFVITATSQSTQVLPRIAVRIEYPEGFTPNQLSPEADIGKYLWLLGDIAPGQEKKITITGTITGEPNQNMSLRAFIGQQDEKNNRSIDTLYATEALPITVMSSFLDAVLVVNGSRDGTLAVPAGAGITGMIGLRNATGARIRDIVVTADISGSLFDMNSVRAGSGGFYNSSQSQVIWNRSTGSRATIIDPGDTVELSFSIDQLQVPTGSGQISISLQGVGIDGSQYSLKNVDRVTVQRASSLPFSQMVSHDGGAIANDGPVPPVANTPTTYTIEWRLTSPTAQLSNIAVQTTLPAYVTWTGVSVPAGAPISYNPSLRQITWSPGSLGSGQSESVSFQVSIVPSVSMIGQSPALTTSVDASGYDTVAGVTVTARRSGVTTQLPSGGIGSGTVVAQ